MSAFTLLDLIFPKRCVSCGKWGSYFCFDCIKRIEIAWPICPVCKRLSDKGNVHPRCKTKYSLDGLIAGFYYKDPVKIAIIRIKYKWTYDIENTLCEYLFKVFKKYDIDRNAILVPVPLHPSRKKWRGFNQSELIAKYFSKKLNQPYIDFLVRVRKTKTQVGLSRARRKVNIRGALDIAKSVDVDKIAGKSFILVDDVYTSGATISECAKVLKRVGAKSVWGMVIALG